MVVADRADLHGHLSLQVQVRRAIASGAAMVVVEVHRGVALSPADVATMLWANRRCTQRHGQLVVVTEPGSDLGLLGSTSLGDAVTITRGTALSTW
ncbi:hypothetical protein [Angustibacter speluncae]